MEQFYQLEKAKKESGFHNFFLGAILLHLILFAVLNMHKVVKLDVTKEAFLKFTLIKLPPSPEVAPQPKEEIQPQKTEVKEDAATVQESSMPKAFKEVEEIFEEFLNSEISLTQLAKKHQLSVNGLKKILTNFTYLGKVRFNDQIHEGNHQPILSSTLFNHVQNKIDRLGIKRI